ncbi:hypothetical protein VNO77_40016 [Canavalia gladiata]|uniref:Peptidase metallopeptidase domain-containing protein n=1 Tax=Canavalia gladiata TaxID=3824 RepID=A0AAN9JZP4_CANGL
MKLYLLDLLLCLPLENSVSAGLVPSLSKGLTKAFRDQKLIYRWLKKIDNLGKKIQPNAPPAMEINGLSSIKEYLSNFRYLEDSGPFNDVLDKETVSAIKTYQNYFNLQVNGGLNNETLQQISLPRCAIPDMNFNSDMVDNVSWPKEGTEWLPKEKRNITYGFLPVSEIPENVTKVFKDSFTRWAEATKVLNLTEARYDDADIKIGFYIFNDSVGDEVFGGSIIRLQPEYNKKTGEIRLDATKYWALPVENQSLSWEESVLDLESVAMHQIGRLLGLDHTSKMDSVMYPTILQSQQRKVQLSDYDKNNIHQHYTTSHTETTGRCRFLTTIFSLIFLYLLLLC